MFFDRYPKKQKIVSEISIKCDQAHLDMLLTNNITEFMKVQYLQNESRDKTDFYMHRYQKKQPFDSNIYIRCAQKYAVTFKSTQGTHGTFKMRCFGLYISRINEGMKQSFHIWVDIYRSNLLIQDMSRII